MKVAEWVQLGFRAQYLGVNTGRNRKTCLLRGQAETKLSAHDEKSHPVAERSMEKLPKGQTTYRDCTNI